MALNIHEKGIYNFKNHTSLQKVKKMWTILCFQASGLAPEMVADVRHGNSLVVRQVLPGRIIVVLFWTKYAVPRQVNQE